MTTKRKGLVITTVAFFLIVNTNHYWAGKLGLFAFPAFLILVVAYLGLTIALIRQTYFAVKEKFSNRSQLFVIGLLITVLALTFYKPFGLINFDRFEGNDLLVAEREGAANCMTTFKLKDDYTFIETSICFGVTEVKGDFHLQHDTIYFDNVSTARYKKEFYEFAVIKQSKYNTDGKHYDLRRYKNLADTVGHDLWITKNELNKLTNGKHNR